MKQREIYCCGCEADVIARLTDGQEIYPHRSDLFMLPFWKCDTCLNYVGCHHKTKNRTQPLGVIPTRQMMVARGQIHALIDPVWKSGKMTRKQVYAIISEAIGREYHTGEIRSMAEANKVIAAAKKAFA